MAKTLTQLNKQIEKLQREAADIKSREVDGVVARIREAISHYGLTKADIFADGRTATRVGVKTRAKRGTAPKKAPLPAKFQDGAGRTWSGHGKRPNWFKDALAAGKTPDDLLAK